MKVSQMLTADNLVSLDLETSVLQAPVPKSLMEIAASVSQPGFLLPSGLFKTGLLRDLNAGLLNSILPTCPMGMRCTLPGSLGPA